jgi:hypothetical protein
MTEIVIYKSRWRAVKILLLTLPFVAIGAWMASATGIDTSDRVIGALCILFFSLGIPVSLFHLFDRRPQIIINQTGIWDRSTKQDIINWEAIKYAYIIEIYRQEFIALMLDESFEVKAPKYKWVARVNELVDAQKVNISLGQVKTDSSKMLRFILLMIKPESDKATKEELLKAALIEWG